MPVILSQVSDRLKSNQEGKSNPGSRNLKNNISGGYSRVDDNKEDDKFGVRIGPLLERTLFSSVIKHRSAGRPLKAVSRLHTILTAEESDSIKEIRRFAAVTSAEILLYGCSNSKYIRPDLDIQSSVKKSRPGSGGGVGAKNSASGSLDSPWKPIKNAGANFFTPKSKYEEIILVLLLAENVALRDAVLNANISGGAKGGGGTSIDEITIIHDLFAITMAR